MTRELQPLEAGNRGLALPPATATYLESLR